MEKTDVPIHNSPSSNQTADSFRGFEQAFKAAQDQRKQALKVEACEHREEQIKEMIAGRITDATWDEIVGQAQKAATQGAKQFLLLRFPSDLCTDDARAINNPPNSTWPQTLQGEAADVYTRWQTSLRPHGFSLSAQVLGFPGGKPGDVGLFLQWGE
jgi:hypothetical protein